MLRITAYIGCIATLAARNPAGEVAEIVDTALAAAAAGVVAAPHTVDTTQVAEVAEMQMLAAADTVRYTAAVEEVVEDTIAGAAGHMTAAVEVVVAAAAVWMWRTANRTLRDWHMDPGEAPRHIEIEKEVIEAVVEEVEGNNFVRVKAHRRAELMAAVAAEVVADMMVHMGVVAPGVVASSIARVEGAKLGFHGGSWMQKMRPDQV